MTARERVRRIARVCVREPSHIALGVQQYTTRSRTVEEAEQEIASAIRSAEAEAYERAAQLMETSLELCGDGCFGVDLTDTREMAAEMIRSLSPKGGETP